MEKWLGSFVPVDLGPDRTIPNYFFPPCAHSVRKYAHGSCLCSGGLGWWMFLFSVAVTNAMTKKQPERKEGFISFWASSHRLSQKEVKAGVQGESLDQRPQKDTSYWLASRHVPTCIVVLPPTVGWALPPQLAIVKIPATNAHRSISWRQLFSCPLFLGDCGLCSFENKNWQVEWASCGRAFVHVCMPGTEQPPLKLPNLFKQIHL